MRYRGGKLPEMEARILMRQIIQGLAAIKSHNVMHRDLKLPNIMLHFNHVPNYPMSSEELKKFVRGFDFAEEHIKVTCKIADLGFARKL